MNGQIDGPGDTGGRWADKVKATYDAMMATMGEGGVMELPWEEFDR